LIPGGIFGTVGVTSSVPFHLSHPEWLILLPVAAVWTLGWARRSDSSLAPRRLRWALALRLAGLLVLVLALAGLQWRRPDFGMNLFFLLDRSDSVPGAVQEQARQLANRWAREKPGTDKGGFLVFGSEAALETTATSVAEAERIQTVVPTDRTDIAAAIRLGTAAFPEQGQRRLVLLSDGNENVSDGLAAIRSARSLGVDLDVVALGSRRGEDLSVQKVEVPASVKQGQAFDVRLVVGTEQARTATVRLYRDNRAIAEQEVVLEPGRNLLSVPQKLDEPGFHAYEVVVDAPGDTVAQNNRASGFIQIRGDPRILVVSSDPEADRFLVQALRAARLEVRVVRETELPSTLAEIQSHDAIVLGNVSAGDLGPDGMRLLESAVRDFGVGLVCIGGDQSFAAGGYRSTPLEEALPLDMELSSRKVLPKGALGLVMHGMEFANGNQVAREIALAALDALGPTDEMGVWLWDGTEKPLFPLQSVGSKTALAQQIAGMNQGDLPGFEGLMTLALGDLQKSTANLKHLIVFSDGDPSAPSDALMQQYLAGRITVSTVMIGGHVQPTTMERMAQQGRGRFYDVRSAAQLPQIFIKEAAVILKSAISEEPFRPQVAAGSELTRGIGSWPMLQGHVATTPKPRAEVPLLTGNGDPLLAHWQHGLGRSVAFTSDARSRWARDWIGWSQYQQFWSQAVRWSLRRVDSSDHAAKVGIDNGVGFLSVESLDTEGNFRNFLDLRAAVVGPGGRRTDLVLEQTGPGRYEGRFAAAEVGAYLVNLLEMKDGRPVGSQVLGASVNHSPEFETDGPDRARLQRLADAGGGSVLDPETDNPFLRNRRRTFRASDLWQVLLQCFVVLMVIDVGVRRVEVDPSEWARWWAGIRSRLGWGSLKTPSPVEEGLQSLLTARDRVREGRTRVGQAGEAVVPVGGPDPTAAEGMSPSGGSGKPEIPDPRGAATQPDRVVGETGSGSVAGEPSTPTSRLLEAKRRAQRRSGGDVES